LRLFYQLQELSDYNIDSAFNAITFVCVCMYVCMNMYLYVYTCIALLSYCKG
jgi:hypothetical protein